MEDDDIKIGKALEEGLDKEEQQTVSELAKEELYSEAGMREDNKSTVIMVAVVAGIFILLIAGFKLYGHFTTAAIIDVDQLHLDNLEGDLDEEEGYLYNGFSFVKVDGLWWTEVIRRDFKEDTLVKIPLHFGPKEVEGIPVSGALSPDFNKGLDVYIAVDPNVVSGHYVVAMREISANVGKGINRNSNGACTVEHEGCGDRKILNCEDPQGLPVIELELSPEPGIEMSGTCMKVKGSDYDIIKAANRLLYDWYGVMG